MIDDGLPECWPNAVRAATAAFRQGDLVVRPPFFYWASLQHPVWDVTIDEAGRDDADPLIALTAEDCAPLGVITTQSCDLAEPKPKRPWFCVAPVIDIESFDAANADDIRAQRFGYLYALPEVPEWPGSWVADLRVEFPIEKGWLVGRSPIRCLSRDAGRTFARALGRIRARLGLEGVPDTVVQDLRKALRRMKANKRNRVVGPIAEDGLRIKLTGNERGVTGMQLYVLGESETPGSETQQWFRAWSDKVAMTVPEDFDYLRPVFDTLDNLSAREYRDLVQLDLL